MPTISASTQITVPVGQRVVINGANARGTVTVSPGSLGQIYDFSGGQEILGPFAKATVLDFQVTSGSLTYDEMADMSAVFSDGTQLVSGSGAASPSFVATPKGRKFAEVAGVLRNLGSGWGLILDSTHDQSNIASVSNNTSTITVDYSGLNVKKVVSFIAGPDETLAKAGFFCGSSVGVNAAQISLKRLKTVSDYVSYNGSAWVSTNGVFTFAFSAGTLTLTHEAVSTTSAGVACSVTGRDGTYVPLAGTATTTATQIRFYDWAGTLQTTENANMKAYVNRGQYSASENPDNVNDTTFTGSNIWIRGIFELN